MFFTLWVGRWGKFVVLKLGFGIEIGEEREIVCGCCDWYCEFWVESGAVEGFDEVMEGGIAEFSIEIRGRRQVNSI